MKKLNREIGWRYDLPGPQVSCTLAPRIKRLNPPPNYFDDIVLELARTSIRSRAILFILGLAILMSSFSMILFIVFEEATFFLRPSIELLTVIITVACSIYAGIPAVRFALEIPRNEPVRFNRVRRKVYFYQYRFDQLRPFGRKGWGVKPVCYHWDDLTAEAYRTYVPGHGGLQEKVMISVSVPGTKKIIDRLFFFDDIDLGEVHWSIARAYMNDGPSALPRFVHPPRDWDDFPNPGPWENATHRNPFDRLAPKVKWPPEMDLESRTAGTAAHSP